MIYLVLPILAGIAISLQSIFSSKMGTKFGFVETIVLIHLFGLISALIVYFIVSDNRSIGFLLKPDIITIIAGCFGVIIVFCTAKSVTINGAVVTIMISVLIQMITSKIIEHFGLFGIEKTPVNPLQILSILIMFGGVLLFQKSS